jgi:hypothetical protein
MNQKIIEHQCGGPQEACLKPGCDECGTLSKSDRCKHDVPLIVCEQCEIEVALLVKERDSLRKELARAQNHIEFTHSTQNILDQVFQGKDSILPDFLFLGECKVKGVIRLAKAYKKEQAARS